MTYLHSHIKFFSRKLFELEEKELLPLNKIVNCQDDCDGSKKYWRGVGDDEEGGGDRQEAGDVEAKHQRHRRVQHIHVFAESVAIEIGKCTRYKEKYLYCKIQIYQVVV
jgi:hypothetical protein